MQCRKLIVHAERRQHMSKLVNEIGIIQNLNNNKKKNKKRKREENENQENTIKKPQQNQQQKKFKNFIEPNSNIPVVLCLFTYKCMLYSNKCKHNTILFL